MAPDVLSEQILGAAAQNTAPDGAPQKTLSTADARGLAERHGMRLREIERAALSQGVVPLRYTRNQKSYACADQIRLLDSSAALVGLGGLGGTVLDVLARAGVGRLVLIDGDRFEEHNLNRQLLCAHPTLGELKAPAAGRRALAVNPAVEVEVHPVFLTADNSGPLIGRCQIVLDCLDNIADRFTLQEAARKAAVPLVSAAVAGLTGHVTTIFPEDAGLEKIYGPRTAVQGGAGAEKQLGCLPQAVVLIAAMQSAEALKILTGKGELLRNRLWVTDLASQTFEVLSLG